MSSSENASKELNCDTPGYFLKIGHLKGFYENLRSVALSLYAGASNMNDKIAVTHLLLHVRIYFGYNIFMGNLVRQLNWTY